MKANVPIQQTLYKQAVNANTKYRQMVSRRVMMATALMLSDLFGFGQVRVLRALKGLAEIFDGYAVYSEHMNKDMAAELRDRGIELPGITDVMEGDI
jgi:hypothetical protein